MIDQRDAAGVSAAAGVAGSSPSAGHRHVGEWIAAGVVIMAGVGVATLLLVRTNDANSTSPANALPPIVSIGASLPTTGSTATTAAATTASAVSATAPADVTASTAAAAAIPGPEAPVATTAPVRYAVFDHGKVYLRGKVPTVAVAQELIDKAGKVVGPANVINEYAIDAAAPLPKSAPLYVADTVLFDTGSAKLRPEFVGLLDLGVVLLTQNPQVTVTIIGHTDNVGDEQMNLTLSQHRVDAALAYLQAKGIDTATRVTGIAKGEADPIGDNATAEGRRLNRRVEFVINGLLD
jgi:outer membrane protein OmpA-like peptidoglycan-associated protein